MVLTITKVGRIGDGMNTNPLNCLPKLLMLAGFFISKCSTRSKDCSGSNNSSSELLKHDDQNSVELVISDGKERNQTYHKFQDKRATDRDQIEHP